MLRTLIFVLGSSLGMVAHADATDPVYPLDDVPRVMPPGTALPCKRAAIPLVRYAGEVLSFQKPVLIYPAFRDKVRAFERLTAEVATRFYGRAPRRIVHVGGYNCREMRRYPDWVSEHALGNAIDIAGFDFAPLPRTHPRYRELPPRVRAGFQLRVVHDWRARGAFTTHAEFLHTLTRAIADRIDIFRVVLGPGYPGHDNHLHLDFAPYRVVEFSVE